jgi:hypothetical protein
MVWKSSYTCMYNLYRRKLSKMSHGQEISMNSVLC